MRALQGTIRMFHGSMVALVTPMTGDGQIDYAAIENLVRWHVEEGTDAIVANGTTGESATLVPSEQLQVLDCCLTTAAGRIPVIAGTGSNSTAHAVELTRRAESHGAAAALVVVPYYNKPTQEGLYRHFRSIAEAVELPIILYNVPSRTVADILPETVVRLAKLPNIAGIKDASGKLERLDAMRERCGKNFVLLSGDDATAMEFMLRGGQGVVSVMANVVPRLVHELCVAACESKRSEAEIIRQRLDTLNHGLFLESNPIPVKWALAEMGRISRGIRLPLTPLAPVHQAALREAMKSVGLL